MRQIDFLALQTTEIFMDDYLAPFASVIRDGVKIANMDKKFIEFFKI